MDWTDCELVEAIPGKVSGVPLLVGTRIPVSAIIENYEAFLAESGNPDEALAETVDCYPSAGVQRVRDILAYYQAHDDQLQS